MESKLAKDSRQRLIERMRRLTPEQRLAAYITHSHLMMSLFKGGSRLEESATLDVLMRTTADGQSALLLFDVVEVLDRESIAYAVIGAMAASIHGVVRASIDADLVISIARKDFASLESTFKAIGFSTSLREGGFEDPIPAMLELMDAFDNRVHVLAGIRGLEPDAFARVIEVPFQGAVLKILGREDFIATKLFDGGPQGLIDAQNTLAVADGTLDLALLRRVTQRFGADPLRALETILNQRSWI